jgi:hypothetical protein
MRYQVIVFLKDSEFECKSFFVNSLRTLHVLERKLTNDARYDSWAIIDRVHANNSNNL